MGRVYMTRSVHNYGENNMKDKKIKRYILGYGFVTIRPYLTHNEIDAIIEQAQNTTDNYAFRQEIGP